MKVVVFAIVAVCDAVLLRSLLTSWIAPSGRVWPPPSNRSWQFWWVWGLIVILCLGLGALTVLDWNSFVVDHWSRLVVGVVFVLLGNVIAWWGVSALSLTATAGLKRKLVTQGPYRFSRNPQYLGDIAILVGWGLIANSELVWLGVLPAIGACLIAPFAEEPWLEEQYGDEYREYRRRVRRFV